jgi:hypothetical protein
MIMDFEHCQKLKDEARANLLRQPNLLVTAGAHVVAPEKRHPWLLGICPVSVQGHILRRELLGAWSNGFATMVTPSRPRAPRSQKCLTERAYLRLEARQQGT